MTENQYRKTIIILLLAFVKMVSLFVRVWVDAQYKPSLDRYKNEAVNDYVILEIKVSDFLKEN